MEGEEVLASAGASSEVDSVAPPPAHDHGISPEESLGFPSAEIHADDDRVHDQEGDPEAEPEHDHGQCGPAGAGVFTDDLKQKIVKQVEYYFSDENLITDKYLMSFIKKNKEGFVPIGIIASFRKMKKLTQDYSSIVAALRESSLLVVSSDGTRVKRLHPLSFTEAKDPKLCTVVVENLPEDHSVENIQRIFGEVGNIKNICIHDPHSVEELKSNKSEKLVSGKLHALVEYENVEAAEKAVAVLNNEQDWRNGMRVKLLKKMGKYVQRRQGWWGTDPDRNTVSRSSSDQGGEEENQKDHHSSNEYLDDNADEEGGEHPSKDKNVHRGQSRGRFRRQKYRGHGTAVSTVGSEFSRPPPGPRMPDGTRGFTMGRGRPPVSDQT